MTRFNNLPAPLSNEFKLQYRWVAISHSSRIPQPDEQISFAVQWSHNCATSEAYLMWLLLIQHCLIRNKIKYFLFIVMILKIARHVTNNIYLLKCIFLKPNEINEVA